MSFGLSFDVSFGPSFSRELVVVIVLEAPGAGYGTPRIGKYAGQGNISVQRGRGTELRIAELVQDREDLENMVGMYILWRRAR